MCCKNIPYFLKGGIVAILIALIYDIITFLSIGNQIFTDWLYSLVLDFVVMFIIGAFIGFIIGLIVKRNRKNKKANNLKRRKKR